MGSVIVKPQFDVLGRNKGRELSYGTGYNNKIAEEKISYVKFGDHATNLPGTMWFADKSNGKYQVKDSLRYAYDKMGITSLLTLPTSIPSSQQLKLS